MGDRRTPWPWGAPFLFEWLPGTVPKSWFTGESLRHEAPPRRPAAAKWALRAAVFVEAEHSPGGLAVELDHASKVQKFLCSDAETVADAIDIVLPCIEPTIVGRQISELLEISQPLRRIPAQVEVRIVFQTLDESIQHKKIPVD